MDDITALVSTIAGDIVSRFQKVREVHDVDCDCVINVSCFLLFYLITAYKPIKKNM